MKIPAFISRNYKAIVFSILNAILLTIVTFLWINKSYFLSDDEEYLIKGTTILTNTTLTSGNKPSKDSVLFINLSWEKQLVNVTNDIGQIIGKRPITNRQRIAQFLNYLNSSPDHRFIILDVWFRDSSDFHSDSLLQAQFSRTKNILIPFHKDELDDNKKALPIFNTPTALSDYEKDDNDNNFTKFKLIQGDHFKTTPLVLYEKLHGKNYEEGFLWNYLNDEMSLNSFILSMRISNWDLEEKKSSLDSVHSEANYIKVQLSELLDLKLPLNDSIPIEVSELLNENFRRYIIHEMTKNKIVIIGDFEDSDIHETIYGPTAGPLILYNAYLALTEKDNIINLSFIIFLLFGYFLISLKCFTKTDPIDKYLLRKLIPNVGLRSLLASIISYVIYLGILSIISYFLFNTHLTILLLAFYMEALERLLQYFSNKFQAKSPEISLSSGS